MATPFSEMKGARDWVQVAKCSAKAWGESREKTLLNVSWDGVERARSRNCPNQSARSWANSALSSKVSAPVSTARIEIAKRVVKEYFRLLARGSGSVARWASRGWGHLGGCLPPFNFTQFHPILEN